MKLKHVPDVGINHVDVMLQKYDVNFASSKEFAKALDFLISTSFSYHYYKSSKNILV